MCAIRGAGLHWEDMSGRQRSRSAAQEKRSQSCFELHGNQYLHASLSTHSLPSTSRQESHTASVHPSLSSTHLSSSRTYSQQSLYKPNRSSRLRVNSAPVSYPEPNYKHMARRCKESVVAAKMITTEKILKTSVPEGESLHSFIIGGRYNSAHQMDSRSLQRLGVYVPRNTSAKAFINPAGTLPPSPAVYGMYPLKKHMPLVVSRPDFSLTRSRHSTADHGLFLVKQDLDRQLMQSNATASNSSLFSQQSSLSNLESGSNLSSERPVMTNCEPEEMNRNVDDISSKTVIKESEENKDRTPVDCNSDKDSHRRSETHQDIKSSREGGEDSSLVYEGDSRRNSVCSGSSDVSDSNLLSPEAQLLTQKILLETESSKRTTREASRYKLSSDKLVSKEVQSDGHDIDRPTCTSFDHMYQNKPLENASKKVSAMDPLVKDDDLTIHTPNTEVVSEVVVASRQNLTFTSVRPQSASCIKSKHQTLKRHTLLNRPKSAMQISCKQKNYSEKSSTIFVDLRNIH